MTEFAIRILVPLILASGWVLCAAPARADEPPNFDALWDFGDPAGTEAKFRAIVPKAEASGNSDYVAQLWTQIARTRGLQKQFDDAHAILDRVEASLKPEMTKARVRYLLERGRAFRSSKQVEKAKPLFLEAWALARTAGHAALACDAGHMMGISEEGDAAIAWDLKTLEYAEASKDPDARGWIGVLSYNMGWAHHEKGDFAKALELFRKDLASRVERKQPAEARIATWCVGRALRSLARLDEAMATQRELEKELEAIGEPDGYVFEEIGELLTANGKAADATPYFAKAYALLKAKAEAEGIDAKRLERMRTLGGVAPAAPVDGPGHPFEDPFIERLIGDWRLTGAIGERKVENRVTARWVLQHQFVEMHLTDVAQRPPRYEAVVLIGFVHAEQRYVAHWCDTFGGAFSALGHGKRSGDSVEFEFAYPTGPFFNTFAWDAKAQGWTLRLESQGPDGKRVLFAEETLRRP